jgi:hypothetical protein
MGVVGLGQGAGGVMPSMAAMRILEKQVAMPEAYDGTFCRENGRESACLVK